MFLYLFGRIKAFNHEVGVASFRYRAREGGLGVAAKAAEVFVCKHQFVDKQANINLETNKTWQQP